MYFPDLTPYEYYVEEGEPPALNIGWLDAEHEFTKETPPLGFLDRLRLLSRTRVKQMRGFEVCPFCPELHSLLTSGNWTEQDQALYHSCFEDGRFSSAEIRVMGLNGRIYASPVMILHHVEAHDYLPPKEFVDAVMQTAP
ncbi:hypothetical protein [Nodosilinea sp. FACHB-13]|uniref:DUF7919 family protein n=1 Tax=Cyanophyceae TaxID=3028117 RepID=UPI001689D70B|nr:hypothetical protein [Nodosilinea sp. FACHB-13]MBD2105473.1 hypothetical protein [Nodosilinea sp. FACHB-13]